MRIIGACEQDHAGVGGALRGQEMGYALHKLGHVNIPIRPQVAAAMLIREAGKVDAVVLAGTWHQLLSGASFAEAIAEAAEMRGIPVIWWYGSNGSIFGSTSPDPARRAADQRRIIDTIAQRQFVACICPYSMGIYERYGLPRDKMRLVPSVFDGDLWTPYDHCNGEHQIVRDRLRYKFEIPSGAFVIGTVGNTPNSKGGDDVLKAIALLKDMPDLHYLILHTPEVNLSKARAKSPDGLREGKSEWDVLQDSKKLAASLGIANRVHFLGMRFPRTAMPQFYRLLNVYCSPSKAENLGQPLVESQMTGLPLVTYQGFSFDFVAAPTAEQIAPSNTVTDDYGLEIPECNPGDLAAAIRRARHHSEKQADRDTTRAWTVDKFGHHRATRMIDAIEEYGRLLNGSPQARVGCQNDAMVAGYKSAADRIELEVGPLKGKCLDIGCNTGNGLEVLSRRWPKSKWIGIDPVPRFAEIAGERGFYTRVAEAENLPFDSASFAFVYARHALEHCRDRAKAVSEIGRILIPGGCCYIQAPIEPNGSRNALHTSPYLRAEDLLADFGFTLPDVAENADWKLVYFGPQPTVAEIVVRKQ